MEDQFVDRASGGRERLAIEQIANRVSVVTSKPA
jgi:hypothetical protein